MQIVSFFFVVDVNSEAVLHSSAGLLESLVVQLRSAEASDSHISRLIRQVLVAQFSWALSHDSIVERFWLIELLSVLRSILISVGVSLGRPAGTIPQS